MKFKNILYICLFLFAGLLYFFYPAILNKDLMPGDLGDARFVNYVLEHGYLFLKQVPIHSSFWDLPIFYPAKNTLAYSEVLLGGMLLYVPIRFFFNPQTSLQIWLFAVCILNYASMYLLLNKIFKFKPLYSSVGAFVFAFSLPRYSQMYHLQLYLQFFSIFSLICFFSIKKNNSKIKNNLLFLSGIILFAMQLYSAFYFGWFMIYSLILTLIIFFIFSDLRKKLFDFLKYFKLEIIVYSVLFLIFIFPLYLHYISVGVVFAFDPAGVNIFNFLKTESKLDTILFNAKYIQSYEENIGMGYLTTIFILIGLFINKYKRKYLALFIAVTLLFFSITFLKKILYISIPGASAIRAPNRIIFLLIPFYSYFIATFLAKIKNKIFLTLAILIIVLEQIPFEHHYEWSKSEHNDRIKAHSIDKNCKVATYIIKSKPDWFLLDIMWVSSIHNVYTKNGYSGYIPKMSDKIFENECWYIIY